jgi:hypothetical protein
MVQHVYTYRAILRQRHSPTVLSTPSVAGKKAGMSKMGKAGIAVAAIAGAGAIYEGVSHIFKRDEAPLNVSSHQFSHMFNALADDDTSKESHQARLLRTKQDLLQALSSV